MTLIMMNQQQKKIIKLDANQIKEALLTKQHNILKYPFKMTTSPNSQEKACGLFNPMISGDTQTHQSEQPMNNFVESKSNNSLDIDGLNLNLDSFDLDQLLFDDFLSTSPMCCDNEMTSSNDQVTQIACDDNVKDDKPERCLSETDEFDYFEKMLLSQQVADNDKAKEDVIKQDVSLDHSGYASKRRLSMFEEESNQDDDGDDDDDDSTQDSFAYSSSNTPASNCSSLSSKKKRARGIYRAEDIKTEEDRANYLERRKKNNQSSKISRANKKNYFKEMDERSVYLTEQNKYLSKKIVLLEEATRLIKDYMIEQFNSGAKKQSE